MKPAGEQEPTKTASMSPAVMPASAIAPRPASTSRS
jgi:hypothetical protein